MVLGSSQRSVVGALGSNGAAAASKTEKVLQLAKKPSYSPHASRDTAASGWPSSGSRRGTARTQGHQEAEQQPRAWLASTR